MRPWFILTACLGVAVPQAVFAQGVYTAEELRDLGRPVAPGAMTLALGGTRGTGLGDATDAAFNPAALVLGPRADVVVSIGGFRYGRNELQRTLSGVDFVDSQVPVLGGLEPIGSGAAAFRTSRFGIGVTYDAVSRLDYARDVDRIRWASWIQRLIDDRQWSLDVQHQRIGAAVGAVLPGHLASVGVAVHADRLRIRYTGRGSNSELLTNLSTGQFSPDSILDNEARLDADTWNLGVTLGAMMQPHPRVDVGVRYVREPRARVDLHDWWARRDRRHQLFSDTNAFIDPPDLVMAGATVRLGRFRVAGEAGAVLAAHTFRDAIETTPNNCPGTSISLAADVPGASYRYPCWQLYTQPVSRPGVSVGMADGADIRVGVERGWQTRQLSWWLRGGVSREAAAVLQTIPLIDDAFVPPDGDRTWIHAGGGIRVGRTITDVGFAHWQHQYRLLIDVRLSTDRDSRSVYGSRR